MITLHDIAIRRGSKLLINHASFCIYKNQKIAITGRNGCGKSSLLALIKGDIDSDAGNLEIPKNLVIAHVAQESPDSQISALEYTLQGDVELSAINQAIININQNHDQLPALYEKLEHIDGYSANSRANALLYGLGFSANDAQKPVNSFSGGWKVRLNLAQALMCRSDLLLLDEPTNHLDLNTVLWLQDWLKRYSGTLLLISHDRDFLDNCADTIAHIEQQTIKVYKGNYTAFEAQRAEYLAQQQSAYDKQQKEIQHIEKFITRFKAKATKAKQAQSRIKTLDKIQMIAKAHVDSPFHFNFTQTIPHLPHTLLELTQTDIGYDDNILLHNINLQIIAGDRIALLGANGAGKSTLIKVLASQIQPQVGELIIAKNIKTGYFAQHQVDQLRPDLSPLQHMVLLDKTAREQDLRNHLGGFDFIGDKVNETTQHFSGGEKSRLALAILVYQQPDVLLLDEPTNHLDLEMRHALALALQDFNGALVIISHDSHLLQTITDKLLLVHDGIVEEFDGDLTDYSKLVLKTYNTRSNTGTNLSKLSRQQNVKQRARKEPLAKLIKKLDVKLIKINKRQQELETLFADIDLYHADKKLKLTKLQQEKIALDSLLEKYEQSWLEASEELEQLSQS